jgi:ABC-type transporter Mla MlaB component
VAEKQTKKSTKKPAKKTAKKTKAKPQKQKISCGEVLDISAVAEFHGVLKKSLASKKSVLLDASAVERADAAALQLLTAYFQDAKRLKKSVEWDSPSDALCSSAALLGLSEILDLAARHN